MTRLALAATMALCAASCGCKNAVYFYQTDKISFTAEGRPDSTSPVSASLGIKQRVALIVPSEAEGEDDDAAGEALPVISFFNFIKQPTGSWMNDQFLIETAFITGCAARSLDADETAAAAAAITSVSFSVGSLSIIQSYNECLSKLADKGDSRAMDLRERLDGLATTLPRRIEFDVWDLDDPSAPGRVLARGHPLSRETFDDFVYYTSNVKASHDGLAALGDGLNTWAENAGVEPAAATLDRDSARAFLDGVRRRVSERYGPLVQEIGTYVISTPCQ